MDILKSYENTLKETQKMKEKAEAEGNEKDVKLISGMITDLKFVICFMKYGCSPTRLKDVSRLSGWQRMKLKGTDQMQLFSSDKAVVPNNGEGVNEEEMNKIERALSVLSKREKEIFVLHAGENLSYERISVLLGVKKGTVSTLWFRAKKKIQKHIDELESIS